MDTLGNITLHNADCMDLLRQMPDNAYDLAIVDPPYGDANSMGGGGTGLENDLTAIRKISRTGGTWATKYSKK